MAAPTGQHPTEPDWPGQRLGLPPSGPGAVAGWGRRLLALFIDWMLSLLAVAAVTRSNPWEYSQSGVVHERYALGVLALEIWLLTSLVAGSAGQVVMRIGVRRVGGGLVDPIRVFVRTLLLLLVIPAVIYNRDQRGLHDLAADSIAVRR
ncbi:MAG: hypothetical protein WKF54_12245 [Nocardioidaceae bacterium]